MAGLNRRSAVTAVVLPLMVLAMTGLARAATFTVTNTGDSNVPGSGSLRDAINSANLAPTVPNTINFTVSGTITLGSALPAIANTSPGSLTIDGSGQAITVDGASSFQILGVNSGANLTLKFLTLLHGAAVVGGGAVFNSGTLTVANSTFSENQAEVGGAILNLATMSVTDSTFSDNQAIGGGAIVNGASIDVIAPQATLTVTNSTFSGNQAGQSGGQNGGRGGAIDNAATVIVTNSTFSDNQVFDGFEGDPGFGGAIANLGNGGPLPASGPLLIVTNSTFSGNLAEVGSHGGAIFNDRSTAMLKGSILASSTPDNCNGAPAITDVGFNISDDSSCAFGSMSKNSNTSLNLVTPPANNGGPTQTVALGTGSSAISFDTECTDQQSPTPQPVLFDQRHFLRPNSPSFCDSGAYEHDGVQSITAVPNTVRLQIARSTQSGSDQVNLALNFIEGIAVPDCLGEDALNDGLVVQLFEGTCTDMTSGPLALSLNPFVVHTINHQSYGTFFESMPRETVSARMVALPTPTETCGEWLLNLEVSGLDTPALGLGGSNPFALVLTDASGVATGCINIDNAIVGNQIDPPSRTVRRGVRR